MNTGNTLRLSTALCRPETISSSDNLVPSRYFSSSASSLSATASTSSGASIELMIMAFLDSLDLMSAKAPVISAPSLSVLFINIIQGKLCSSSRPQARSVPTSTPEAVSMTMIALSTARKPATTSPKKSA